MENITFPVKITSVFLRIQRIIALLMVLVIKIFTFEYCFRVMYMKKY